MEPTLDPAEPQDKTTDDLLEEMTASRDEAVTHGHDLDAMLTAVNDPMVVYDQQTGIVRTNPAFRALLQHYAHAPATATLQERSEGLALRDLQGALLPEAQLPQQRILRGESITERDPAQILTRDANGVEGFFKVTGEPLYRNDELSGAVVLFRDATEQRQLEGALRQRQGELQAIFDTLSEALFLYDASGQLTGVNAAARQLLPMDAAEHATRPLPERAASFHVRDERGNPLPHEQWPLTRLLRGETLLGDEQATVRIDLPDGRDRFLSYTGSPIRDADGRISGYIALGRDITKRKLIEEALRASEAQLIVELAEMSQLQQISRQLLKEGDGDGLYVQLLEAAIQVMGADMGSIQMFERERNELRLLAYQGFDPASAAFWEWVRVDSHSTCGMALKTGERVVVQDVEASDSLAGTRDLDYYRLSGIRAVQSTPLLSRDGHLLGMVSTHWRVPHQPGEREVRLLDVVARQAADLIERAHAQAELRRSHDELELRVAERTHELGLANRTLRRLSQRILQVQESERRLIARELHDEIGQQLTGAKMLLDSLDDEFRHPSSDAVAAVSPTAQDPLSITQVGEVRSIVGDTLEHVRDLSLELRPAILDSLGLLPALRWLFGRYTNQTSVQVDFAVKGLDRRLPIHLEAVIYRLIQEALTNVARYAGVTAVTVQLYATEETLTLYVVDRGVGIDLDQTLAAGDSTGIAGMRERATLLGGTLSVDSLPGEGTTIQAEFSIPRAIEDETLRETEESEMYAGWRLAPDEEARHRARDELRDRGRDQWRDAGRDAKRDTVRDTLRDLSRDAQRDAERDALQNQQQERKERKS
jgi:PAS domain S-box-containing protein